MITDFDRCYRAVQSRDARFDGWFITAVRSTGIYCRPSCPAITPKRANVSFYPSAAAAQSAGYRACKRCRPDASPGSPEWNARSDVAARAMRLIADGVIDREGVAGLAKRLAYSERHLHRQLVAEVGAGPQALARAQRAQTARILIETTDLRFADIAFAAGFASVRQFNDTVRAVFADVPSRLRQRAADGHAGSTGTLTLRLPYRPPLHAAGLVEFFAARAVSGVEEVVGGAYRRTLGLPRAAAVVELAPQDDHVRATLRLGDLRDLGPAVQRCRRLLDLDADPAAVDEALAEDALLGPIINRGPGRRVPGCPDGFEAAVRAVVGQQISVSGARTILGGLATRSGQPLAVPDGGLTHVFPTPVEIAEAPDAALPMPAARRAALRRLAEAVADRRLALDPGSDRDGARQSLQALPGVGPWTASYVAMRGLGDPDVFLPTDLGVRRAIERAGGDGNPAAVAELARPWRPWRSYALQYLWASLDFEQGAAA